MIPDLPKSFKGTKEDHEKYVEMVVSIIKDSMIKSFEKGGVIHFNATKPGLHQDYLPGGKVVWIDNGSRYFTIEVDNPYELPIED